MTSSLPPIRATSLMQSPDGRRRVHQADEYMAAIAAKCAVRHLERAAFVVLKKAPLGDIPR